MADVGRRELSVQLDRGRGDDEVGEPERAVAPSPAPAEVAGPSRDGLRQGRPAQARGRALRRSALRRSALAAPRSPLRSPRRISTLVTSDATSLRSRLAIQSMAEREPRSTSMTTVVSITVSGSANAPPAAPGVLCPRDEGPRRTRLPRSAGGPSRTPPSSPLAGGRAPSRHRRHPPGTRRSPP